MKEPHKELDLAKVLAAAAWADGEVTAAEREKIRRVAAQLGLSDEEVAEIDATLANPCGIAETESLAADFLARATAQEREDLLRRLGELFQADGEVGEGERGLLSSLRAWESEAPEVPTFLGRLRRLLARDRSKAPESGAPFQKITSRMRGAQASDKLTPGQREHAVLFGAILYRTAFADGRVEESEVSQLHGILTSGIGLDEETAEQIISVISARAAEDMDRQRLCASFNRISTMEERMRLLGCLFAVAKADGTIDEDEMREIRLAANYLWIDARSFHDIRQRAPGRSRS